MRSSPAQAPGLDTLGFRELGNAVLLGSQSFWEGVDIPGDALSLVVMDKLPFASPGDPVVSARIDAIRGNELEECYIRPIVYRGFGQVGINPLKSPVEVAIAVWRPKRSSWALLKASGVFA